MPPLHMCVHTLLYACQIWRTVRYGECFSYRNCFPQRYLKRKSPTDCTRGPSMVVVVVSTPRMHSGTTLNNNPPRHSPRDIYLWETRSNMAHSPTALICGGNTTVANFNSRDNMQYSITSKCYTYDASESVWTERASLRTARFNHGMSVYAGVCMLWSLCPQWLRINSVKYCIFSKYRYKKSAE